MTIKEARIANGFTRAQAAKVLKVSKRTIEAWEKGERNPKRDTDKMIEFLEIAGKYKDVDPQNYKEYKQKEINSIKGAEEVLKIIPKEIIDILSIDQTKQLIQAIITNT